MFTGIIEETGKVLSLKDVDGKKRLTVGSSQLVRDLKKGDSIAVSGVCLTAIVIGRDSFGADLAHETVERTSFTRLRPDAIARTTYRSEMIPDGSAAVSLRTTAAPTSSSERIRATSTREASGATQTTRSETSVDTGIAPTFIGFMLSACTCPAVHLGPKVPFAAQPVGRRIRVSG